MYLCSNERLYFLKRCVDGLLETVWYGKSLFGGNNRSGDWFVVRKTVVLALDNLCPCYIFLYRGIRFL